MEIKILVDSSAVSDKFKTAWGLSILIDDFFLFDTGPDYSILSANLNNFGIKPDITEVFISHIHNDHVGGLSGVLENYDVKNVYLPEVKNECVKKYKKSGVKIYALNSFRKIKSNKNYEFYTSGSFYVVYKGFKFYEHLLVIKTNRGLYVFVGCSHFGIANIISRIKGFFKDEIYFLCGGFHLKDKDESFIKSVAENVKSYGVKYIAPIHCSGNKAKEIFSEMFKDDYINLKCGSEVNI